jgi:hypothetical protein
MTGVQPCSWGLILVGDDAADDLAVVEVLVTRVDTVE